MKTNIVEKLEVINCDQCKPKLTVVQPVVPGKKLAKQMKCQYIEMLEWERLDQCHSLG